MHTVELLDEALGLAEECGFRIRQEWLGGVGGGACEFAGQKWLFVDLALNSIEQLDQVLEALRADAAAYVLEAHPVLKSRLNGRQAA